MLNDLSSAASLIATRRSAKPRDMVQPGPDETQLRWILQAAMRVPDHGKLAPWRFVVIGTDTRDAFADMLVKAFREERSDARPADIEKLDQFAHQAPTLVAVLSTPNGSSPIPYSDQRSSADAACMTMLLAAHALGFVGGWLTGWAATSPTVAMRLGYPHAKIAGFIFLGSPGRAPEERPRPDLDAILSVWRG
jgi:nitroreductase